MAFILRGDILQKRRKTSASCYYVTGRNHCEKNYTREKGRDGGRENEAESMYTALDPGGGGEQRQKMRATNA